MPLTTVDEFENGVIVYCKVHKKYGVGATHKQARCDVKKKIGPAKLKEWSEYYEECGYD